MELEYVAGIGNLKVWVWDCFLRRGAYDWFCGGERRFCFGTLSDLSQFIEWDRTGQDRAVPRLASVSHIS
jgi:hypothetical protein